MRVIAMFMIISINFAFAIDDMSYIRKDFNPNIDITKLDIIPTKKNLKCSLVGSKFSDIVTKLKTVTASYDSQCVSRAQRIITDIQTDMTDLQGLEQEYSTSVDSTEPRELMTDEQASRLTTTLGGLGNIISERQCKSEFEETGFLPILASTIQSISQVAMLVPTSNAVMIGIGGSLLTSTLRVIENIFTPDFEWANEEDRKAFLSFNCSYQEVKQQIEASGVYNIKDKRMINKMELLKSRITKLSEEIETIGPITIQLNEMIKEKEELLAEVSAVRAEQISLRFIAKDTLESQRVIVQEIDLAIATLDELSKVEKSEFNISKAVAFKKVVRNYDRISFNLAEVTPESSNVFDRILFDEAQKTLSQISISNASALMAMNHDNLISLTSQLYIAKKTLVNIMEQRKLAGLNLLTDNELSEIVSKVVTDESIEAKYAAMIEEVIESNEIDYNKEESLLEASKYELANLENELEIIESQVGTTGKERYTSHDEASDNENTIFELDMKNAERIYGPVGFSFIEYLVHSSQTKLKNFEDNLDVFNKRINLNADIQSEFASRIDQCTTLATMKQFYIGSTFSSELAYDFVVTNLNLFHGLLKGSFFLSDERKEIKSHAYSALYAKKLIEKFYDQTDTSIMTIAELKEAAMNLKYLDESTKCRRKREANSITTKRVCRTDYENVLFKDSIGMAMIKSITLEDKALEIQRKYNLLCSDINI